MIIKSITLRNFRNYRAETLSFHEKFNLITGDNAQGKTNLLESINLLCTFRPFKQLKIEELVTFGEPDGRIKGEIASDSALDEVHIVIRKNGKGVKLNGKVIYNLSKFVGRFNVVTFLPADSELVKGSPQERRKYIDILICTFSPEHLKDMKGYHRSVMQRNALLAQSSKPVKEMFDIWNDKIAELGGKIVKRRIKFIEKLQPMVEETYRSISGAKADIKISYKSSLKLDGNIEEELVKELDQRIAQDKKRGHTSIGPHRDLIEFTIDGRDTSAFASQGEAKTFALALKASEIRLVQTLLRRTPTLLLDDVTSELDEKRRGFLFGLLKEFTGQVFVSTASPEEVSYKGSKKVFQIKAGKVEHQSE